MLIGRTISCMMKPIFTSLYFYNSAVVGKNETGKTAERNSCATESYALRTKAMPSNPEYVDSHLASHKLASPS